MKKPPKRPGLPPRKQENGKRRLSSDIAPHTIRDLRRMVTYTGSPKHKRNPTIFGLEPFNGERGDATLCDEHANVRPSDMAGIPRLLDRGLRAGLVGTNIWSVGDDGWIFEASLTNSVQAEYHGYPIRPTEAIAEVIYHRFRAWAEQMGDAEDQQAAANCAALYGFRR